MEFGSNESSGRILLFCGGEMKVRIYNIELIKLESKDEILESSN